MSIIANSYEWKVKGIWKQDANVVGNELEALANKNNLSPEAVLDRARPVDSPLHGLFEWDNSIAAEKYRLSQARQLIQQVTIVTNHPNAEPKQIRAFVTTNENNCHYQVITTVIQDAEAYTVTLMRAKAELEAFRNKYKDLVELKELFEEIDKVLFE